MRNLLYIFEIQVKDNYRTDQYAAAWLAASNHIQRLPGALGTRLHRKMGCSDKLLAIAVWETKKARDAATKNPTPEVERIILSQTPFVQIDIIGEYEDAEWEVAHGMPQEEKKQP